MLEQQLGDLVACHAMFPMRVMREPSNLLRTMIDHLEGWTRQLINQLFNHPAFSRLEASWRSLQLLVDETENTPGLRVAVLDCTRHELVRDLQRRDDPGKSILYDKIVDDGLGSFGGFPFGLVIGDFYVTRDQEDVELLHGIGTICAMAHTAFVTAAAPSFLGCTRFSELSHATDLASILKHPDWSGWHDFRTGKPARQTVLVVPRFLLREAHKEVTFADDPLIFSERAETSAEEEGLWGNAAFLVAIEAARSFHATGWFARPGRPEAGKSLDGTMTFRTEAPLTAARSLSLLELGVMPLCLAASSGSIVFPSFSTCYRPKMAAAGAEKNREYLATRLDILLDAGRLAHLAKGQAQNKIFATLDPAQVTEVLGELLTAVPLAGSCFDGEISIRLERPVGSVREYSIMLETNVKANLSTAPLAIQVTGLVLG